MTVAGREFDVSIEHSSGTTILHLERSRKKFLNYIRKRIADPQTAEDILQDCFLKAVQSSSSIHDDEKLIPWFYRVLRNAITDVYRRRAADEKRRIQYTELVDDSQWMEDKKAICECFADLLPTMKTEYTEVIEALDLQENNPAQVAKSLGISKNNLKVRSHRARQALRKRLVETCKICAVHHCLDCSCKAREQLG